MKDFLAVLNAASLTIAIIAGLFAGGYLAAFHPAVDPRRELVRRSILQGWYFASTGSILYGGRLAFSVATSQGDGIRVATAWLLWLLFAAAITVGAYIGGGIRHATRR